MHEDQKFVSPASEVSSANWQATADGERTAKLAAYLDAVSVMPLFQRIMEQTLAFLRLAPGQHVLEVGCGNGVFLPVLAAGVGPHGHVDAIDHSAQFVAAAQERMNGAGLQAVVLVQEADAYHLPFPDATFDAAHCERVLMHLDDPTAALCEMRRVVKPGGRVVATEAHWQGIQIDHPDHVAMELLYNRFCTLTFRQPRMGLTLNRHLFEAGFVEREVVPALDYGTDYSVIKQYGFDPTNAANELITEGRLTRERVNDLLAYLETASANGSYWWYGGGVVGAGQVPA